METIILRKNEINVNLFENQKLIIFKEIKKNEEYVCVKWVGSSDPSQNRPSVCLVWEKREVPFFRRK